MNRIKYPRTFHLPWSQGKTSDDKVLSSIDHFIGKEVVVTEKLDGENTTLYCDGYIHARSVDSQHHPSRTWVKNWWAAKYMSFPSEWRLCGENVYAQHSIKYNNLESYFYGFSIWDENNRCVEWDFTLDIFKDLDIVCVPILYEGIFDSETLIALTKTIDKKASEGYVVRIKDGFDHKDFDKSVAKYVRENHVTTDEHWMNKEVKPNKLRTQS